MSRLLTTLILIVFAVSAGAAEIDPAVALAAAKTQIAGKNYAKAVSQLEPAVEAARKIADPAQQKQALTALHFYLAVALSGQGKDDAALPHLEEALRLTPNMRNLDPSKFDARFVKLFERAKGVEEGGEPGRFEELYPGFSPAAPIESATSSLDNLNPAVEILGTRAEKRAWHDAKSAEARTTFLDEFWKQRDQTPGTNENEYRDTFTRRLAFADTAFATSGVRGAMSDRGRVFALLGTPALVRRRTMSANEAGNVQALSRGSLGIEVGTVEYWIYRGDQLSVPTAQPTVTFRFISHQGVGAFVLQKDGVAINTLTAASNAVSHE